MDIYSGLKNRRSSSSDARPARRKGGAGDIAADNPGGVVNINRFVAILFDDAFEIVGDRIQRLQLMRTNLPAAFADALHGIVKAVGMINVAADGSAAQAGAHLVIAINIRAGIVGFDPDDFIVTHV